MCVCTGWYQCVCVGVCVDRVVPVSVCVSFRKLSESVACEILSLCRGLVTVTQTEAGSHASLKRLRNV